MTDEGNITLGATVVIAKLEGIQFKSLQPEWPTYPAIHK